VQFHKTAFAELVLILGTTAVALAQWQAIGNVTAVTPTSNGMELEAGRARIRVTAISPSIIRIRYAPDGTFPPEHSFAVLPENGFTPPQVRVTNGPQSAEFTTENLRVRVTKSPLNVAISNSAGDVILRDDPQRPAVWNGKSFRLYEAMPVNEHYFGLGEKAGPLDHRGQAFTNWNTDAYKYQESTDPLYQTVPFFIGFREGRAYGLFFDNTYRSNFDFGRELRDTYSLGAEGGELDYYFFYGPEPRNVIEEYTALTGRTPLPPLFALGFQQSRYSYSPESRVLEIASEFRRRHIPADVLYIDIDYQEKNRPFTVDTQRFPHFQQMIQQLTQEGFKIVLITDLHIAKVPGYKPYDEGIANDYFVKNPNGSVFVGTVWPGDSVFPDFTRGEVRQWWGSLYRDFVGDGVRGFWNDMNEPSVFSDEKTMPLGTLHRIDGRTTDHREVHNVYGMENACATYEGVLKLRPNERPLVLTRAGYAGIQRCAATWTGDNSSSWNHMRISVPMLLNLGLSGNAFVGDDIGGYAGSPPPDLLTRWIELGAFNPFYRDHTEKGSADQEPWVHGTEQEQIRRRYIELRYRLLPYVYTAMEETSRTGVPLMRPMFLEFPEEPSLTTNETEFMFGDAFLVAPKLREGPDPVHVTLPAGDWFDFWSGKPLKGGRELEVNATLDVLPLYVRAGSIIPEQPLIQHVGETPQGPLRLHIFPGAGCHGSIYADDGESFAYKRGELQRTMFTCNVSTKGVDVSIAAPQGSFTPWWRTFEVTVYGAAAAPRQVSVDGKNRSDWKFDGSAGTISIQLPSGHSAVLSVQY
jgi:alpha-glucosidase